MPPVLDRCRSEPLDVRGESFAASAIVRIGVEIDAVLETVERVSAIRCIGGSRKPEPQQRYDEDETWQSTNHSSHVASLTGSRAG